MYVQMCVKGIAGRSSAVGPGLDWDEARALIRDGHGIFSNRWRQRREIAPDEIVEALTGHNLDRHLHDYALFGPGTPFISLAAGAVERNALARRNFDYHAVDTALGFATDDWSHPGALFYCWVATTLSPAVELSFVAEAVRDLLAYRAWSPYQLEGEVTAKVHIPANQIERIEWWDEGFSDSEPQYSWTNPGYVEPEPLMNLRKLF